LLLPFALACSSPRTRPAASASFSVSTSPTTSPASAAVPNEGGLARLVAAARAAQAVPYSGTQQVLVQAASGMRSSTVDVVHAPNSSIRLTVHPTAGAAGRSPTAPTGTRTYVGQLTGPSLLPAVDERALARISSRYLVRGPSPGPAVAGRSTQVVELVRAVAPGAGTVAARFWLDRITALPLRRHVLDAGGRLQQASEYVSISFSPTAAASRPTGGATQVAAVVGTPLDLGQGVTEQQLDALRRQRWLAPARLPEGFDLVDARVHGSERGRTATPDPSATPEPPTTPGPTAPPLVLQLTYTDGIAVLSLFEQQGRLDAAPLSGWTRRQRAAGTVFVDPGTPHRAVWSAGGSIYTLVGDDAAAVDDAMAALPGPIPAPGVTSRLRRGVERFGSWVNPFS
jgi:hypothetical protein